METGLKNRVAIVAASSQGIGRATAEGFAAEGCRVAMCARNRATLEQAANKIREQYNTEVFAEPVDVTDANAVHRFVAAIAAKLSNVDITLTSISTKQPVADLVLSNAVRAAVVGLVKSLANEFGKDGILVNNVGPGYTATDRLKELAKSRSAAQAKSENEIFEAWAADAPLKRLGNPKEVADTIVWLASERASYITGQTILVDGGLYKGL